MAQDKVIDSFLVALGFEIDGEQLTEFRNQLKDTRKAALDIVGIATAAAGAIGLFVTKVAAGIDDLGDFAERNRVTAQYVQELGYAAQLNGSSIAQVRESIASANRVIGEAALGIGRGAMTFKRLHMQVKNANGTVKTFDQIIGDVSDKMSKLSNEESIAMAEKLGLDASLVPLLRKGREAIEAYAEEARQAGVLSEEDVQAASDNADAMDRIKFVLGAVTRSIAVGLMPAVTGIINGFREWVLQNGKIIRSTIITFVKTLSGVIAVVWDWTVRLGRALVRTIDFLSQFNVVVYAAAAAVGVLIAVSVGKWFIGLIRLVRIATATIAGFNLTALLVPLIIGAVAIALGLLIDDLVNFAEGNDSAFGALLEKFPALQKIFDELKGPVGELVDALVTLATTVVGFLWPIAKAVFEGIASVIKTILPLLVPIVSIITDVLVAGIVLLTTTITLLGKAVKWVFDGIATEFQLFTDKVFGIVKVFVDLIQKAKDFFGSSKNITARLQTEGGGPGEQSLPTQRRGLPPWRSNPTTPNQQTTTTQSSTVVHGGITVVSSDPAKAGEAVEKKLNSVNKQTTRNGQSAVEL